MTDTSTHHDTVETAAEEVRPDATAGTTEAAEAAPAASSDDAKAATSAESQEKAHTEDEPTPVEKHAPREDIPTKDTAEASDGTAKTERPGGNLFSHLSKRTLFFGSLAVIGLLCFIIAEKDSFASFFDYLGNLLSPIFLGCVIAYLCNPILSLYEYKILRRMKNTEVRRGLSLFLTVLTFFGIIALILLMIIPELLDSFGMLIENYESYINGLLVILNDFINSITANMPVEIDISDINKLNVYLNDIFGSGEEIMTAIMNWFAGANVVGGIGNAVIGLFNGILDLVIALFIAFYILSSREKRTAQLHKFRKAVFTERQDHRITQLIHLADDTFSGFVFGVLIDAVVVGVLTFVILTIFEVSPYNLLIAAFVAVTNIIPVFGPFIGAIPSAFIVLISNPSKLFLFIILILIIQQIDGNILCPKIQGDNTGISSLTVLISITIAGSIWGLVGMVIGVPICAVIIELGKQAIESRLKAKGEPTDTALYYPKDALGNAEKDVYYEHAGLLYKYEHSRFKKLFKRTQRKVFGVETPGRTRKEKEAEEAKAAKEAEKEAEKAAKEAEKVAEKAAEEAEQPEESTHTPAVEATEKKEE